MVKQNRYEHVQSVQLLQIGSYSFVEVCVQVDVRIGFFAKLGISKSCYPVKSIH